MPSSQWVTVLVTVSENSKNRGKLSRVYESHLATISIVHIKHLRRLRIYNPVSFYHPFCPDTKSIIKQTTPRPGFPSNRFLFPNRSTPSTWMMHRIAYS